MRERTSSFNRLLMIHILLVGVTVSLVKAAWYQQDMNVILGDEVKSTAAEGETSLKPFPNIYSSTECVMLCRNSCQKKPFYVEAANQCYCLVDSEDVIRKISVADTKKEGSLMKEVYKEVTFCCRTSI